MSNTVKRKSVKTDTAIKVIAIGILGYIGLKTIPTLAGINPSSFIPIMLVIGGVAVAVNLTKKR